MSGKKPPEDDLRNVERSDDGDSDSAESIEEHRSTSPGEPLGGSGHTLPGLPFAWRDAEDSIYDFAYDRIADIARRRLAKERGNISFQPTELVNEAWLKLHGNDTPIRNKEHFIALAAIAIRQVLIDHLRKRRAEKHGGKMGRVDLTLAVFEDQKQSEEHRIDLLDLDAEFKRLESIDAARARAVELWLFGSMDYESIARVMDITVYRAKQLVKAGLAWLRSRLGTDSI